MIPTIEDIVAGLRDGTIDYDEAIHWLNEHKRLAAEATLRDEFACAALQGVLQELDPALSGPVARFSYEIADAMLKERSR